jgi:hypothetical protein
VNTVLRGLPDEEIAVESMESTGPLANPFDPSQGFADGDDDKPYDPWEDEPADSETTAQPTAAYLDISALRAKTKK